MKEKLECSACGHAQLIDDRSQEQCPECGSSEIRFEVSGSTREDKLSDDNDTQIPSNLKSPRYWVCRTCGHHMESIKQRRNCAECGSNNLKEVTSFKEKKLRLICGKCKLEQSATDKRLKNCPNCDSTDIFYLKVNAGEETVNKPSKVLWDSSREAVRRRVIIGIIGFILMIVGAITVSGMIVIPILIIGPIIGGILMVIGVTLMVIATKLTIGDVLNPWKYSWTFAALFPKKYKKKKIESIGS